MSTERVYEGQELELFSAARNWKAYWSSKMARHLGESVLEVGAGLGENTAYLQGTRRRTWTCLEPDAALAAQIPKTHRGQTWAGEVRVIPGMLRDLPTDARFDTILYIDVLEHIEDDAGEMRAAISFLNPGGKIVVLSPAYPSLYTDFDKALGHYRRYENRALRACTPAGARLIELFHLDAVGLFASLANKLFLSQSLPTPKQIALWDGVMVPISRVVDPVIGFSAGKSLVGVWEREG